MAKKRRATHKAVLLGKYEQVKALEAENVELQKHNPNAVAIAIIALNALKIAQIIASIVRRVRRKK